jgi:hypothetical protein
MTGDRDAVIRAAKTAGYRRVNTAGGPVDLDDWQPYGATKGDPRTAYPVTFTLIEDEQNPRIEDVTPSGSIGGIWQLGI